MHGSEIRAAARGEAEMPAEAAPEAQEPIEEVEETPPNEEPASEKEATEEPVEEPKAEAEPEEKPAVSEEAKPKHSRYTAKVQAQNAEIKRLRDENEYLRSQNLPNDQSELDMPTLNKVIDTRAQIIANEKLAQTLQVQAVQDLEVSWNSELKRAVELYPQLNADSPKYNPKMEKIILQQLTDAQGNKRLDIDPLEAVSDYMDTLGIVQKEAKEQGKSEASATLAKQSQESAVTPTGKVSEPEKEDLYGGMNKIAAEKFRRVSKYINKPFD